MSTRERIPRNFAPSRRWLQFSVRTLLIFTTLCAVVAWLGSTWTRAQRQKHSVQLLTEEKDWDRIPTNRIIYDFERDGRDSPKYAPKWLVNMFGVDLFANVVALDWRDYSHGELEVEGAAALEMLRDFSELEELRVYSRHLTDGDLAILNGHGNLRRLEFTFSPISGVGFKDSSFRHQLRELSLHGCPVSDEGMAVIAGMENLEELNLNLGNGGLFEQRFSAIGLAHLTRLKRLKTLHLAGAILADDDLASIAKLRSLEHLTFSPFQSRKATGAGIAQLRALTRLKYLHVSPGFETIVPDSGMERVVKALADAVDAKDWRRFEAANADWEAAANRNAKLVQ